VVTHQLQVERRTGKVRRSQTDVLPLCHATNLYDVYSGTIADVEAIVVELYGDVVGLMVYVTWFQTVSRITE